MAADAEAIFDIEFRRQIDGLTYDFVPDGVRNGRASWRRTDLDLHLLWSPEAGWIVCDDRGVLLSRPWTIEREQQGPLPPDGVWVSRKGQKSYVYDCIRR